MGTKVKQVNKGIFYSALGLFPSIRKIRLELAHSEATSEFCRRAVVFHESACLAIQAELAFLRLIQRRNDLFVEGHPVWNEITHWYDRG